MADFEMPTGLEGLPFYTCGLMNAGINVNSADITMGPAAINSFPLTELSYNWSLGRRAGWTSRYGIFPVPGHNSNENGALIPVTAPTTVMMGYAMRNIVAAEQAQATHPYSFGSVRGYDVYDLRKMVFGAIVIPLPVGQSPLGSTVPMLYWMTSRTLVDGSTRFDLAPSTEIINTGQMMGIRSHFEAGVGSGAAIISQGFGLDLLNEVDPVGNSRVTREVARTFQPTDRLQCIDLNSLRKIESTFTQKYLRSAIVQGSINTNITEAAMSGASSDPGARPGLSSFGWYGCPFWVNTKPQRREISVEVAGQGANPKKWSFKGFYSTTAPDLVPTSGINRAGDGDGVFPASTQGGSLDFENATVGIWTTYGAFTNSPTYFCRFSQAPLTVPITVVAVVTSRPVVAIFNPFIRDSLEANGVGGTQSRPGGGSNDFVQWMDPTSNLHTPKKQITYDGSGSSIQYTETGAAAGSLAVPKQTCWGVAPSFVFGTQTANVIAIDTAGALKPNTVYEYAFSVYNVMSGKESNVGVPAKAYVGTDNSVIRVLTSTQFPGDDEDTLNCLFPITIRTGGTGRTYWYDQYDHGSNNQYVNGWLPVNYMYYRLYYREQGSFEWLFSGEHSFAKVHYESFPEAIYIGRTDAVGGVGGQPGGFNDYSDLPSDQYIDVCGFQGRLFWMTRGQLLWSRGDDVISYPVKSTFPAPAGEFRGMVPHFFSGQAAQNGRLVIFASDGNYEGKFTGILRQEQVRVSATAAPVAVPVDGSDFIVNPRGSDTAFSGRAAVVAEGILYFMGPTGIFRDDGVNLPMRISQAIEPEYFDTFSQQATDECFAYYNKKSREVLFFYRPSTTNADANPNNYLTKAWVYSLRTESAANGIIGAWSQYGYNQLIDWAQDLELSRFETPVHGSGVRTLIGSRRNSSATVSRPYFHDDDCDGGDYKPGDEMMVKEIQKPDASTVRFILAAGYSTTIHTGIVAGTTKIAVKLSQTYGDLTSAQSADGYYTVKAKGSGYLDVDSTGLSGVPAQTFTIFQYFPIFVEGYHDVVCKLQGNFLAPEGLIRWHIVRYLHILIKAVKQGLGAASPTATAQFEANHQQSAVTSTKSFSVYPLNSRESTSQVILDIPSTNSQAEGQAVRTTLTYNQLAGRWTLFAMTHYYEQNGPDENKYYQQ